jgi:hypothetical protein
MITFNKFKRLVEVLFFSLLLTGISTEIASSQDNLNKVEIISPRAGSVLIPEKSMLVLQFTGPEALKTSTCDTGFRFWMLGTDGSGRSALFARNYNSSVSAGLVLMEGHTSKVTTEGIECSIDLNKNIQSRSKTNVSDLTYKEDWAKTYLEAHGQPSDKASVERFVSGWKYLVANPSAITKVTLSSLGLDNPFVLKPVTYSAISGASELEVRGLARGVTLSTGDPLIVEYSGAPNELPKTVSIIIKTLESNGERECLIQSNESKPGSRTIIRYACRIPRIYAAGQAQIYAQTKDTDDWTVVTEPVVINLIKSSTEKLSISANATECQGCGYGVLRITGKVNWESDKGVFPLFDQDITVCGGACPSRTNVRTNSKGEFSYDLTFIDPDITSPWIATWSVLATASDLSTKVSERYTFKRVVKKVTPAPTYISPRFNLKLSVSTKSKINWGDQVVAVVRGTGSGSGTCVAQFQEELKTFSLKAGQAKTIRIDPRYAENKKFALNLGCGPNPNWWGRFFDPRFSWNYASVKTSRYVTMIVSSNLDGY